MVVLAAVITVRAASEMAPSSTTAGISAAGQAATQTPQAGYVGSDTCMGCHDQADTMKGTAHANALNPRSPAAVHGCESCHGPGQAHVNDDAKENIRKFGQIKPAE